MKCLIYPYYDNLQPLVQNQSELKMDVEITHLVYPQAWKHKINLSITGVKTSCNFEETILAVEGVIIPDVTKLNFMYFDVLKKIDCALSQNKQVLCYTKLSQSDLVEFREYGMNFVYLYEDTSHICLQNYHFQSLECIALGFGGLVRDLDDITVIIRAARQFQQKGYKVAIVSPNATCQIIGGYQFPIGIFNECSDEEKKVLSLNKYFCSLYEDTGCDIILVQYPDSMMKYSDYCPEDYGVKAFILSQAISIDFFTLISPVEQMDSEAFQMLSTMFEYRFDFQIDACYIEHKQIDLSSAQESEKISFGTVSREFVTEYIEELSKGMSSILFLDINDPNCSDTLVEACIQSLSDNIDKV